jgi:hypothetical protein
MKVLIDVGLPAGLKEPLAALGHECETVRRAGYGAIELTLNNAMTRTKKGGVLIGGRNRVVLWVTFGSSPLS